MSSRRPINWMLFLALVFFVAVPAFALAGQTFVNSIGQRFVLIQAGTFVMGSPSGEADRNSDELQHQVTISRPYYLQATEVTQGQWKAVMGNHPSYFSDRGADCPVEQVSWNEVREYIGRLNAKEGGGGKYRLPTEAEWEYAARAGNRTPYHFGESATDLEEYAWYNVNSDRMPHPVATRKPNAWGLYDMAGNVWEWCQDWYGDYPSGSVSDPRGPAGGSFRVYRGGGWSDDLRSCRSADRGWFKPGYRGIDLGFRLAKTP